MIQCAAADSDPVGKIMAVAISDIQFTWRDDMCRSELAANFLHPSTEAVAQNDSKRILQLRKAVRKKKCFCAICR